MGKNTYNDMAKYLCCILGNMLGFKITQNVAKNPLQHVTYAFAKIKVTTSNSLGGNAFTNKIHYLTFELEGQGHTQ